MEPQNTFVVRFWLEPSQDDGPAAMSWYGRVQHIQSGEGAAFRHARQLLAFIERYVALEPQGTAEEKQ